MKTIAFFNNKGGVGKTSLVYHLAWMCADHGIPTLAVDLDPQANLTSLFFTENELDDLWGDRDPSRTLYGAVMPLLRGTGDIAPLPPVRISDKLGLLPGDLRLFGLEEPLASAWTRSASGDEAAFRILTALPRVIDAAASAGYQLILMDLAPSLGAINRSGLRSASHLCVPIVPDLASLHGLKLLGSQLAGWREADRQLLGHAPQAIPISAFAIQPMGYVVVLRQALYRGSVPNAYQQWLNRIPPAYHNYLLNESQAPPMSVDKDPECLGLIKHQSSLMSMAMAARKPMFFLKSADGAIGAHIEAVRSGYRDFEQLAARIVGKAGIPFN